MSTTESFFGNDGSRARRYGIQSLPWIRGFLTAFDHEKHDKYERSATRARWREGPALPPPARRVVDWRKGYTP